MSPTVGNTVAKETGKATMVRARARAELVPDLLVQARRVANNVFAGWHGRRKRGIGENFWQYRPYTVGENMSAIDWRKSARDDQIYVKDREWQAAHTIWLWVDESPSMLYKSDAAIVAKQSRALVLAFAMAELLARSGERIGWLGLTQPISSRNAAERLAEALILAPDQETIPQSHPMGSHSDLIIFSDFLDPLDEVKQSLDHLNGRGVRGHGVQLIDPAEEVFPYRGRTEFVDPEGGQRYVAGNAATLASDYAQVFAERNLRLGDMFGKLGWNHVRHHTDRLASEALVALHMRLSEGHAMARGGGGM